MQSRAADDFGEIRRRMLEIAKTNTAKFVGQIDWATLDDDELRRNNFALWLQFSNEMGCTHTSVSSLNGRPFCYFLSSRKCAKAGQCQPP